MVGWYGHQSCCGSLWQQVQDAGWGALPSAKCPLYRLSCPDHSRLVAGGWLLLLLLDAAHLAAQDAEVPADTGRRCLPCHCAAPMPWRLAWKLAASPPLLAIGGHLDLANWQLWLFTCLRLPRSCPFPTRLRWLSLQYWTTASTVFCVDYGLQCGCCHGRLLDSILPFHI